MNKAKSPKRRVGRPRLYNTEAERKAALRAQNRAYQKAYLEKRRERYATDPDYRAKVLERNKRRYRNSLTPALAKGHLRVLVVNSPKGKFRAVKRDDFADSVGLKHRTLRQWVRTKRFPAPSLKGPDGEPLYDAQCAKRLQEALLRAMGSRSVLRASDSRTINVLMDIAKL